MRPITLPEDSEASPEVSAVLQALQALLAFILSA